MQRTTQLSQSEAPERSEAVLPDRAVSAGNEVVRRPTILVGSAPFRQSLFDVGAATVATTGISVYYGSLRSTDLFVDFSNSFIAFNAALSSLSLSLIIIGLVTEQMYREEEVTRAMDYLNQAYRQAYNPQVSILEEKNDEPSELEEKEPVAHSALKDAMDVYTTKVTEIFNAGHISSKDFYKVAKAQYDLVVAHKACCESKHTDSNFPDSTVTELNEAMDRFERDTSIPCLVENKACAFAKNTVIDLVRGMLLMKYVAMAAMATISLPYAIAAVSILSALVIAKNSYYAFFKPTMAAINAERTGMKKAVMDSTTVAPSA